MFILDSFLNFSRRFLKKVLNSYCGKFLLDLSWMLVCVSAPPPGMMGGSYSMGGSGPGAVKCFPTGSQQPAMVPGDRSDFTDNDDQLSSGSTPNAKRKGLPGSKRKSSLFSVSTQQLLLCFFLFGWDDKRWFCVSERGK